MSETAYFEIAHAIPGRTRLRWRGEDAPPPELLHRLGSIAGVSGTEYRPTSQSLLLRHESRLDLERLDGLTRELGVETRPAPPPPTLATRKRKEPHERGDLDWLVADAEALLLVGLMVTWLRDLVIGRTLRVGTVLLLILTGLNLWEYWHKRKERHLREEGDIGEGLELLRA